MHDFCSLVVSDPPRGARLRLRKTYLPARALFLRLGLRSSGGWCRRGESEFGASLTRRNLLILLNARNAKNTEFAKVRYTRGTRKETLRQTGRRFLLAKITCAAGGIVFLKTAVCEI